MLVAQSGKRLQCPQLLTHPCIASIKKEKKSTRASPPCCRAIKRCMILSSLGISAACYIHRRCECVLCAPATCYLQLQPAEGGRAFSQRTDLSGEKKMGGVWGWLQISHWLTAPTGCWRQGPDTCMKSSHGARLHGVKARLPSLSFCPGDDITMCRPCLPCDFGRDPASCSWCYRPY